MIELAGLNIRSVKMTIFGECNLLFAAVSQRILFEYLESTAVIIIQSSVFFYRTHGFALFLQLPRHFVLMS